MIKNSDILAAAARQTCLVLEAKETWDALSNHLSDVRIARNEAYEDGGSKELQERFDRVLRLVIRARDRYSRRVNFPPAPENASENSLDSDIVEQLEVYDGAIDAALREYYLSSEDDSDKWESVVAAETQRDCFYTATRVLGIDFETDKEAYNF
jgi:hypothetical protein